MKQNKPSILIANGTMNAGGTETLIMEILRHQTGRVRYILMVHYQDQIQEGIFDDEIRSLGVEIVYIPSVGSIGINGYCKQFQEVVAHLGKIDVIHSHLNANGGIICKAAKMAGIKHRICHCHADIRFKGSRVTNLKEELVLQVLRLYVNHYCTDFWACSNEAWKRLFYPWKKKVVIHNMIDVQKYLTSSSEKGKAKAAIGLEGKFIVGSVGRVARIKNYELVLEAIAILKKKAIETHFVCYGRFDSKKDAYCAELLTLAEKFGIMDMVHFMDNTTNVARDIKAFDVFLMPSTTEGFGMAAIEAQAAGLPSLLSTGVPRIVDVELGLVNFLITNPQEWADTIYQSLKESTYRPHFIPHKRILEAFDKKGYNSVSMVIEIENKYIRMVE